MPQTEQLPVVESLAQALETMAFMAIVPAEGPVAVPANLMRISITFRGPVSGRVELVAGEALGALLAGNVLGTGPDDPQAMAQARDVLKELVNITCGVLLGTLPDPQSSFEMDVPEVEELTEPGQWEQCVSSHGAQIFDADGCALAIRIASAY